ncbi:MAG: nascent polypeptide-associated complex protein [Nanoarchaeota archaeon]
MIPGMNPRMMKQAMKRMNMSQEDIDAIEVIIKCHDKEIIVSPAQVAKVNMMGQEVFQVSGDFVEREIDMAPEINEEDIQTIIDQTNVSREIALEALEANNHDIAATIIYLNENKEQR